MLLYPPAPKYQGWSHFREKIIHVLNELNKLNLNDNIIRYSLKYAEFFPKEDDSNLFDKLNVSLNMAYESMSNYPINIKSIKMKAHF